MTLGGPDIARRPAARARTPSVVPVIRTSSQITLGARRGAAGRAAATTSSRSGSPPRAGTTGHVLEETLLLLDGGAETTRTVIGSMIRELALQPDQRQLLVDRPELLGDDRGGGVHPLGDADPQHAAHRHRGARAARPDAPRGRPGAADVRGGEPRPSAFDRPRPSRRDPARTTATSRSGSARTSASAPALARLEIRVMFEELLRRIPEWELVDPDRAADRARRRSPAPTTASASATRPDERSAPMQVPVAEGVFTWPSRRPAADRQPVRRRAGSSRSPRRTRARAARRPTMAEHLLARRGRLWAWTTQDFPPPSPPYAGPTGERLRAVRRRLRRAARRGEGRGAAHRVRSRRARAPAWRWSWCWCRSAPTTTATRS